MARFPAAKKSEKTRKFTIAPGFRIGNPNGNMKMLTEGAEVELTKKQAEHLMKLRAINVELPDFGGDSEDDTEQAGAEPALEGAGDATVGAVPAKDEVQTQGDAPVRRRKASSSA